MSEKYIEKDVDIQTTPFSQNQQDEDEDGFDLVGILMSCLSNWYWFIICVGITLLIAFFYVKKQEPIYTRSATILIKETSSGANNKLDVQEDMGVFKSTNTVSNEIFAMRSPQVVNEVVKRLKLNINYSREGRLHRRTLYGDGCPIDVVFHDVKDDQWVNVTVELLENGEIELCDISGFSDVIKGKLNERLQTPVGAITVLPTSGYFGQEMEIFVSHWSVEATSGVYQGGLVIEDRAKSAVVDLTISDVSQQRAEDFLNTLIQVYSEFWVNDRNQIAQSTNQFISERIAVIEKELGSVDSEISNYKSENLIPDGPNGGLYTGIQNTKSQEIVELNNQVSMTKFLLDYVKDEKNAKKLIPSVSGMGDNSVSSLINNYNEKVIERNSLVAHSSEVNPLVLEYDEELNNLHHVILQTIENQLVTLSTQLKSTQATESKATQKMANTPSQAKYLLSVERQQAVKQTLYTYLLQKREENELSQAFTAYNTRILNPASGSSLPTSPNTNKIYLIAFAIGLVFPAALIVLSELLNTTVRGRKDLDRMRTPFLGEIPFAQTDKRSFYERMFDAKDLKNFIKNEPFIFRILSNFGLWKKSDRESDRNLKLYVKPGSRNQINEAFRVVRSNMDFMKKDEERKVIMITSANAGSGKTFISLNLAASFVVKDKKVLVIDLDFRKRSLSKYVNRPAKGLVDYLAGMSPTYADLIVKGSLLENLDVLPVGKIPPNPTELLYEDKLEIMLNELRSEYDMIFLDCPPVEIVADSSIIAKYADKTIFLIRAGLLQRSMLPEIDKFYYTKKFGNMSLMLNGTDDSYSKYGYSRYGYRYGYHYGYGGHYGNGGGYFE